MVRMWLRAWPVVCLVVVILGTWRAQSNAISIDKNGEIRFGVRAYTNARLGTQHTHDGVLIPTTGRHLTSVSGTFPQSSAGHLRQNRYFIEAELNHDLTRLLREGVGPLALLNYLPFKIKRLSYHVTFRGEGDGIFDFGPKEFSTAREFEKVREALPPLSLIANNQQAFVDVFGARHTLRKLASDRERLFQAFVQASVGNLFLRVGRQVLSWGETDGFQLLDHINPLDNGFGGFLIALDERRVPLDMALANYYFGSLGPFSEMFLEGYLAIDNKVGFFPGTPAGSPWALPSLGAPTNVSRTILDQPARTLTNATGGFRFVFNALDATFSIAHYYTHFDTPAVQVFTNPNLPGSGTTKGLLSAFDDGQPCPSLSDPTKPDPSRRHCGAPTRIVATAPRVQVTGGSVTFAVPQFYSIVRGEIAYFKDEPAFTQGQLDPFIFNPLRRTKNSKTTGGRRLRDSINAVIGIDKNQWIRALNSHQTFLFSTQFFYKHINNAAGRKIFRPDGSINPDREVLPIIFDLRDVFLRGSNVGRLEPIFIRQPANQYLQTLFVGTSYRSGTINPGFTLFYDWGGAFLYQPSVTFIRDPFRLTIDFSILDSHIFKGGSGVSLFKDRDNVQFKFEYDL
ncbi:MAG: DUF1302 family protein [Candidatus Binatia bacterium]